MNLTSHDDNGTMQVEATLIPDYIAFTSLFLCSIVLAVGLLGNLMVIIVILTSKALRSSTNMFLLNLSVADMLVLATCTPSTLVEIATRKTDAWYMGKVLQSIYSSTSSTPNGYFFKALNSSIFPSDPPIAESTDLLNIYLFPIYKLKVETESRLAKFFLTQFFSSHSQIDLGDVLLNSLRGIVGVTHQHFNHLSHYVRALLRHLLTPPSQFGLYQKQSMYYLPRRLDLCLWPDCSHPDNDRVPDCSRIRSELFYSSRLSLAKILPHFYHHCILLHTSPDFGAFVHEDCTELGTLH